MCPGTLALIAAGTTAVSAIGGGIASASSASYQGAVARNNATIARQNAGYSAAAGSSQITQQGLKARSQEGSLRAGIAASGVDVNSGSAADVQTSQRELNALDSATVANRAAEQVYGYGTQATSYDAQSKLDQAQVPWDIAGGVLKAAGGLAGSASSLPGGGGGGGGGGGSGLANEGGYSLLSGPPSVPDAYQWMTTPDGGIDTGA